MQLETSTSGSSRELKWIHIGPPEIRTRVYGFAFLPGKPQELIVGTRPDGFYKVNTMDESWERIDVDCQFTLGIGPNQHGVAISPHDCNLLFLGIEQHGILKSTDAGLHWTYANTGLRGKETLALNGICFCFHPKDKRIVFYGSDGGIYRSLDAGQTWMHLQQGLPPLRHNPRTQGKYLATSVWKLGIHPVYPERVYAGFFCTPPDVSAGMYFSNNAGDSWHLCSAGLPEGKFPDHNDHKGVIDFAISNIHPEVIFVGLRKGLFKTHDGGVSWHSCGSFTMPIRAICLHPYNANDVFRLLATWCG